MSTTRVTLLLIAAVLSAAAAQHIRPQLPYPYATYPQTYGFPPIQPYPYYPQLFTGNPYYHHPQTVNKKADDPYAHIPTEIIDVNESDDVVIVGTTSTISPVIEPDADIPTTTDSRLRIGPYIAEFQQQQYSGLSNGTRSVHIIESKPIQTIIRRVITGDGRDGKNVINIHIVNGVEVTTEGGGSLGKKGKEVNEAKEREEEEEEEEEKESEDDNNDPKPIDSWIL